MGINKGVGRHFHHAAFDRAFALPTVLITSIVMLTVLLSALTAASSISAGLKNQYLNQLSRTAAQSGMTMAKACMSGNGGTVTWTAAKPLKPNTDCVGTETTSCPITATSAVCYVLKADNYRTTFKVKVDSTGTDISVQGIVREVRKSSGQVVYQSETSLKMTMSTPMELLEEVGATNSIVSLTPATTSFGYGYSTNSGTVSNSGGLTTGTRLCGLTDAGEVWCAGSVDTLTDISSASPAYSFPVGANGWSSGYPGYYSYEAPTVSTDIGYLGGSRTCYDGSVATTASCSIGVKNDANYADYMYLTNLSNSSTGIFKGKVFGPPPLPAQPTAPQGIVY